MNTVIIYLRKRQQSLEAVLSFELPTYYHNIVRNWLLIDLDPTRKHDMESLMYTILHLHKNKKTLWKSTIDFGFNSNSGEIKSLSARLRKLSDKKKNADPYYMWGDIHNGEQLAELYRYILDLEYSQRPDYDYIIEW